MKDGVTKVQITKSDITDGKPVIGAELIITDTDGNEIERWTTTEEPHYIEMLPIGTYTLTEITSPSGYATAEAVGFTVEDTGEIQKVDMKDAPITAEISKKDIADGAGGNELPGAHLTVKNEKGEVIDDWVSTNEPHKMVMLPVGKYTLTEVTAPNGYELAETITFDITDTGEVHKVTMYDAPKEETVDLTGKRKKTTKKQTYTPGPGSGTSVVSGPVKTGDETPVPAMILLAVCSAFAAGGIIIVRRKRKRA
jgi:LPXTG-motif cell wall-anchored protein